MRVRYGPMRRRYLMEARAEETAAVGSWTRRSRSRARPTPVAQAQRGRRPVPLPAGEV